MSDDYGAAFKEQKNMRRTERHRNIFTAGVLNAVLKIDSDE